MIAMAEHKNSRESPTANVEFNNDRVDHSKLQVKTFKWAFNSPLSIYNKSSKISKN